MANSSETGSVIFQVNSAMFFGVMFLCLAWWSVPSSLEMFGFWMFVLAFGGSGFGLIVRAMRVAWADYVKRKSMFEIEATGSDSRQADFMSARQREKFRAKDLKA